MVDYSNLGTIGVLLSIPVNLAIGVFALLAVLYAIAGLCRMVVWALELPMNLQLIRFGKEINQLAADVDALNRNLAEIDRELEELAACNEATSRENTAARA